MCIICVLPRDTKLSEEEFENCWDSNPDGGGYTLSTPEGLVTKKSCDKQEFKKMWKEDSVKFGATIPRLVHFRVGTCGLKTEFNCHPFIINKGLVMAHNGVIPIAIPESRKDESDTHYFVKEVMKRLPRWWMSNPALAYMLTQTVGSGSKLVFLDKTGEFTFINKKSGTEDNGRWFSNHSFKWIKNKGSSTSSNVHMGFRGGNYANNWRTGNHYIGAVNYQTCGCCGAIDKYSNTRPVQGVEWCLTCKGIADYLHDKKGILFHESIELTRLIMKSHTRQFIPPWDTFWGEVHKLPQKEQDQIIDEQFTNPTKKKDEKKTQSVNTNLPLLAAGSKKGGSTLTEEDFHVVAKKGPSESIVTGDSILSDQDRIMRAYGGIPFG